MDIQIGFGGAIKASGNKVEGYLVRFGSPESTDLDGEFFSADTDFGRPIKTGDTFPLNLYWHHGLDSKVGKREIGTGQVKADDVGLWYEATIAQSDAYLQSIGKLAGKGRLGFSSGAGAHLVEKAPVAGTKATLITRWPLAEASLTHCPAEPTNSAATKSLAEYKADWAEMSAAQMSGDAVAFAAAAFESVPREILSSGLSRLYDCLTMGIYEACAGDGIDHAAAVDALLTEFAARAKDFASRVMAMPEDTMAEEMDAMKALASKPDSITLFERRLRDALGFSRREAKALASHGYKALRDAAPEPTDPTPAADTARADARKALLLQSLAAQKFAA